MHVSLQREGHEPKHVHPSWCARANTHPVDFTTPEAITFHGPQPSSAAHGRSPRTATTPPLIRGTTQTGYVPVTQLTGARRQARLPRQPVISAVACRPPTETSTPLA